MISLSEFDLVPKTKFYYTYFSKKQAAHIKSECSDETFKNMLVNVHNSWLSSYNEYQELKVKYRNLSEEWLNSDEVYGSHKYLSQMTFLQHSITDKRRIYAKNKDSYSKMIEQINTTDSSFCSLILFENEEWVK